MTTPYQNCKSLVKTCEEFHRDPFKTYFPDTWYYRWWYLPKCGHPDYDKLFRHAPQKQMCEEMASGKIVFNSLRFRDACLNNEQHIKKHVIPKQKKKASWFSFFDFWKEQTEEVQQVIRLPLLKHKKDWKEQVDSGHGLFLLTGNAFLMHRHPDVVVYDPFFDRHQKFDIQWFGRLVQLPGSYYIFNQLYSNFCLSMEFEESHNPFRWTVKKDNFDQFVMHVDTNKKILFIEVRSPFLRLQRSFFLQEKTFLCFPILVTLPGGAGHMTSLVYHLKKQTWEHFESNGYIWFWSDHMDDYLEARLSTLIHLGSRDSDMHLPFHKFIRVRDITPQPCFQQLDKKGKIQGVDVGDYCATWTFWYLHIRFSNPRHLPHFIVKKIIEGVEKQEKMDSYIVFVRSFAIVIGRIVQELRHVFSSYSIKSWFSSAAVYQEKVREIFDYYIKTYFE